VRISNLSKNTVLANRAKLADTFFSRLIGLLNRNSLDQSEALVITRCQSIHMFFMRFAIDAVFVNANDEVVGFVEGIKPFRISPLFFQSSYCIELPVGTIQKSRISIGDSLKIDKSV